MSWCILKSPSHCLLFVAGMKTGIIIRSILSAAAMCSASVTVGVADESFEIVTSVTTFSTSRGVNKNAVPAYVLDRAEYQPEPITRQLVNDLILNAPTTIPTNIRRSIKLVRDAEAERQYDAVKSVGAIGVAITFGWEAAAGYAVYAGALGAFKPAEQAIENLVAKEDRYRTLPISSPEFRRLSEARLAFVGKDGKVVFSDYKAMASDRSGAGDFLHYTLRSIRSPTSPNFFSSYVLKEIVSFVSGHALGRAGAHPIAEEAIGSFLGSAFEEEMLRRTAPAGQESRYVTYSVGSRTVTIPRADLTPSSSLSPSTDIPKVVIGLAGALPSAPHAVETAVTTFRAHGINSLLVAQPAPATVIVRPNAVEPVPDFTLQQKLPAERSAADNHSIDLPSSIEIHGLGDFSIKR